MNRGPNRSSTSPDVCHRNQCGRSIRGACLAAGAVGEPDADRLLLRRRPLDRQPRRRRCPAAHLRDRNRDGSRLLARWFADRLHRRVRRQRRCLRRARGRRRAATTDLHPGTDEVVGWTPDGKRVLFRSGDELSYSVVRLFTVPVGGGFPKRCRLTRAVEGLVLPGRRSPGLRADPAVAAGMEALSRRTDDADLDRGARRFPHRDSIPRDNSNDFNPMWVGDTIYFLSDRNGPVTLFAYDTKSKQVTEVVKNTGPRHQVGLGGARTPSSTSSSAPSTCSTSKSGRDRALSIRVVGDLPEVRPHFEKIESRAHHARRPLADRRARRVRSARRDPDRAGREGRRPQPDQHARPWWSAIPRGRPTAIDRLFLRRVRRVRLARPRPERPGRSAQDRPRHAAVVLLLADLVAGQQEDRLHRQAPEPLVRGPRQEDARQGRHRHLRGSLPGVRPAPGRPTASGSRTRSSCATTCTPSSSTPWSRGRAIRSPTA